MLETQILDLQASCKKRGAKATTTKLFITFTIFTISNKLGLSLLTAILKTLMVIFGLMFNLLVITYVFLDNHSGKTGFIGHKKENKGIIVFYLYSRVIDVSG